jgi:processive 1,2-diacylglycerol beta-glucosyltransferase
MRALITTVTAGGGHLAAAAALEEAWRALRPRDVVERVDVLRFFSPLQRKIHSKGYVKLVEHAPELWGMLFGKTDSPKLVRRLARLRRALPGKSRDRLARHIKQFKPDAVLCTHYLPFETLTYMRKEEAKANRARRGGSVFNRGRMPAEHGCHLPFVVSVVTDFEAHALWMDSCVDLYCVAAEETKARLIARGAAVENIVTTGIPIAAKFSMRAGVQKLRGDLGLRRDQPVLLVLSGGFGVGPVAKVLAALDKVKRPIQTIVVTGRNPELQRELASQDRRQTTHVLGFASNMHELMAVADLIITKPGGLTASEALAMGKPIFILDPIPGQEAANSDYLLEHGAAMKVNRVEDLPYRIEPLLGSKRLADLARAAKALGKPGAAKQVCREVVRRLAERWDDE